MKKFTLLGIIVMSIALFFSCGTEDVYENDLHVQPDQNKNSFDTKYLSLEEAFKDSAFLHLIGSNSEPETNEVLLKRGTKKKKIKVDKEKVIKHKREDYESYTLLVDSIYEEPQKFCNLLMEKKGAEKNFYLVTYLPEKSWYALNTHGIATPYHGSIEVAQINSDNVELKSFDCSWIYSFVEATCPCHGHHVGQTCNCYETPHYYYAQTLYCRSGGSSDPVTHIPTDNGNVWDNGNEDNSGDFSSTTTLTPEDPDGFYNYVAEVEASLGIIVGDPTEIAISNPYYVQLQTFLEQGKHVAWDEYGGCYYKCQGKWIYYRDGQNWADLGYGNWHEIQLVTTSLSAELVNLIGTSVSAAAINVLRYLTPAEEAYILLEGVDFNGLEQSQLTATGFLLISVIPVTKILKPVSKLLKAPAKVIVSNFATAELLLRHFSDHAMEFGSKFATKEAYALGAKNFFARDIDHAILQYTRNGGDIVRYDRINNIFGICSSDGTIRTFFKPTGGINYFKNELIQDFPANGAKVYNEMINGL